MLAWAEGLADRDANSCACKRPHRPTPPPTFPPATQFFRAACFHPEGGELVTGGDDKSFTYWDVRACARLRSVQASQVCVNVVVGGGLADTSRPHSWQR